MNPSADQNPIRRLNPISDGNAVRAASSETLADLAHAIVATPVPPQRARWRAEPRAGRWLLPAPLLVAALGALVVVLTTAGEGGTSLVSRAYAAISPTGAIVHYLERTTMSYRIGDAAVRELQTSASEVWTSGARVHAVTTLTAPMSSRVHRHATIEIAIEGRRMTTYAAGRILHAPSPSCITARPLGLPLTGCEANPVASLRDAYRTGKLHAGGETMLDGHRVAVITGRVHFGGTVVQSVRVFIDPGTFIPLEIESTSSGRLRGGPLNGQAWQQMTTSAFAQYQRLPLTSRNRELLTLRSQPHARS